VVSTLFLEPDMKLSKMTEVYQRGGREELIIAIEIFSATTKAEMLFDLDTNPASNGLRRRYPIPAEPQPSVEDCCY